LSIAGPNSRKVLQAIVHNDVSNEAFKFMSIAKMNVGMATALVGRVSFTGDLGYEIWCKPEYLCHIFDVLMAAGEPYGIELFGTRALNSLRLEKGYGNWASEYRPVYEPVECGLNRFIAMEKDADFIGKAALGEEMKNRQHYRLSTFIVDSENADAIGNEPIFFNNEPIGWVTSGGFAHAAGVSVALGYVPVDIAQETVGWETEIIGKRVALTPQREPLFDADTKKMRS